MEPIEHPSVIVGVLTLAALYILASRIYGEAPNRGQLTAFSGALVSLLVALSGPIDRLADERLFTAHMSQHLILGLVFPPLFLLGTPGWMLRPLIRPKLIYRLARIITNPIVAFALYNGLLVALHLPAIFDRMCRDEAFHIAMHLAIIITGVITWWPLLSPLPELPRLSYPAQMLYLFLQLIPMASVAAPISLAETVIYRYYATPYPHPFNLSPLADQILGGLVMWVGAGFYMTAVFTIIFYRWARRDDRDRPIVVDSSSPRQHAKARA